MITITEQDYLTYTGRSLALELPDKDDGSMKVERTINLWTKRIYIIMTSPIPKDEDMTELQVQSIKDCICEYGEYYFKNGDMHRLSGFDEDKGQLLVPSEIAKIRYPEVCYEILRRSGLIRRSLSVRSKYNQNLDTYGGY